MWRAHSSAFAATHVHSSSWRKYTHGTRQNVAAVEKTRARQAHVKMNSCSVRPAGDGQVASAPREKRSIDDAFAWGRRRRGLLRLPCRGYTVTILKTIGHYPYPFLHLSVLSRYSGGVHPSDPIGASFTEAIRCDSTGPPVIGAQRDARSFVVPDAARTWATDREEDVHSLFKKKEEEDIRAVLWLTPPPYPSRPCHCC
jgi:hypothetical protein